jgi:hypothetical protein
MSTDEQPSKNGQSGASPQQHAKVRGRPFAKGNGGRKPGSKNRTTQLAEALLEGEAEEIVRKMKEMALAGNVPMLKCLGDRILPKQRTVRIDLPPMERAEDAIDALGAIINAIAEGRITPSEGAAMASSVSTYASAVKVHEHEARLDKMERELEALKGA